MPSIPTLESFADPDRRPGQMAGRACGVLVASMVLSFFLGVSVAAGIAEQPWVDALVWTALLLIPVGLSLLFTVLTSQMAVRSHRTRDAMLVLFAGMVGPPTGVFLITCYGAVFAAGAGLIAFFITAPVVLASRMARRRGASEAHEALIGATALVAGGLVVLVAQAAIVWPHVGPFAFEVWPLVFPPALAAAGALVLAGPPTRRRTLRLRLLDRVLGGTVPHVEADVANGIAMLRRVEIHPGGPHRGGLGEVPLGGFALDRAATTWGTVVSVLAVLLAVAAFGFVLA